MTSTCTPTKTHASSSDSSKSSASNTNHTGIFSGMKFSKTPMMFLLVMMFLVLGVSKTFGQAEGDFRSAASANWNVNTTWERFTAGNWDPAPAFPTNADGVITIRTPHNVTISAIGLSYDQVVVDAGAQVTVASTITSTLANGTGTDLIINGTWLNSGGTWTVTGAAWSVNAAGTYIHNTTSGISTPLGQATLDPASTFICKRPVNHVL